MSTLDHGELNAPLASRYGKGGIDAALDRYNAEQRRARAAEHKAARKAAREADAARPKLTREDVEGARFVRDRWSWHTVIRVNEKTVTVAGDFDDLRIPFARLLEVRR